MCVTCDGLGRCPGCFPYRQPILTEIGSIRTQLCIRWVKKVERWFCFFVVFFCCCLVFLDWYCIRDIKMHPGDSSSLPCGQASGFFFFFFPLRTFSVNTTKTSCSCKKMSQTCVNPLKIKALHPLVLSSHTHINKSLPVSLCSHVNNRCCSVLALCLLSLCFNHCDVLLPRK